jgi:hypothetical protein
MVDEKHDFAKSDKQQDTEQFASGGQVSEGPNSLSNKETSIGGADSVPDTPDTMPPVARGAGPEPVTGE